MRAVWCLASLVAQKLLKTEDAQPWNAANYRGTELAARANARREAVQQAKSFTAVCPTGPSVRPEGAVKATSEHTLRGWA